MVGGGGLFENWTNNDCAFIDSSDLSYYCDICRVELINSWKIIKRKYMKLVIKFANFYAFIRQLMAEEKRSWEAFLYRR